MSLRAICHVVQATYNSITSLNHVIQCIENRISQIVYHAIVMNLKLHVYKYMIIQSK